MKPLSRVRLLATPWTVAYQAPPSMGFSRQEYWSGVPLGCRKQACGNRGEVVGERKEIGTGIDKYTLLLLLLLLSRFSRVRLCATPEMETHQVPPSLEFSRQEHWSGLPFPSPMRESEVNQSCPTLRDPMDCSLPGSSV